MVDPTVVPDLRTANVFCGPITIDDATPATTSRTRGALVVTGGVAVSTTCRING